MSMTKFSLEWALREWARWLLTPSPFSNSPRPTEQEIEDVVEFLRHVDWGSIEWEDEE